MNEKIVLKNQKTELKPEYAKICSCPKYDVWVCNLGFAERRYEDGRVVRGFNEYWWDSAVKPSGLTISMQTAIALSFVPNPFLLPFVKRKVGSKPPSADNLLWKSTKETVRVHRVGAPWRFFTQKWLDVAEEEIAKLEEKDKITKAVERHIRERFRDAEED